MVLTKYLLEVIVFVVGAAVMILELAGSRVLAPYFGTSIVIWTSLIGIILGSLALGYFWGGRVADRDANFGTFSLIIFGGALFVGLTAFSNPVILGWIGKAIGDIRVGSVAATVILFAPASILLGMVSPYAVRLKIKDLKRSGRTVGSLYAISTIGSIVGTFLTGFWLISFLGNTKILYLVAIILVLTSLIAYLRGISKTKIFLGLFLVAALVATALEEQRTKESGFVDVDTQYNRVWIFNSQDPLTGRLLRVLMIDPLTTQSAMFLDSDELVFNYTKFYRLAGHFKGDINQSLLVGGAGYSYPKDYLKNYPDSKLDVVEIDPRLTELARTYFGLKDNPRLSIYHEDGRIYLNRVHKKYDVIFGDAFSASYSIPYQLTTREAALRMYDLLSDDGLVLVNMISSIEGRTGKFLRAEYHTFKAVFPQVYVLPVEDKNNGKEIQNILLVALKSEKQASFESDDKEFAGYLEHLWKEEIPEDVGILTDEKAPVDQYMLELISS